MQTLVLLFILAVVQSQAHESQEEDDKNCNGVTVNGEYYEVELLKKDIDRPYLLIVDQQNGDLYFSYSTQDEEDVFRSARLNLYSKEYNEIEGINNGFATAINEKKSYIYIGGSDGIYTYDKQLNKVKIVAAKGNNIWSMFFKNKLYFSTYPTQYMYIYDKNGDVQRFHDLGETKVDHFIVDANDTIFFTNDTGLYTQQLGTSEQTLFQEFPEVGARALAVDKNGTAHVCLQDGIYSINKKARSLKKLLHIDDAFGLAFDNQNTIIYSDVNSLMRLKKSENKNCL